MKVELIEKLSEFRNHQSELFDEHGKAYKQLSHVAPMTRMLKLINILEKEVIELSHHKDTTVGLYAIDFDPKILIEKFNASQSDACSLVCEDLEQLIKDWYKFINNENYHKSPFFQIT